MCTKRDRTHTRKFVANSVNLLELDVGDIGDLLWQLSFSPSSSLSAAKRCPAASSNRSSGLSATAVAASVAVVDRSPPSFSSSSAGASLQMSCTVGVCITAPSGPPIVDASKRGPPSHSSRFASNSITDTIILICAKCGVGGVGWVGMDYVDFEYWSIVSARSVRVMTSAVVVGWMIGEQFARSRIAVRSLTTGSLIVV